MENIKEKKDLKNIIEDVIKSYDNSLSEKFEEIHNKLDKIELTVENTNSTLKKIDEKLMNYIILNR